MGTEIALIFGSVAYDDWTFLRPFRGRARVVCADGGLFCARQAGFCPDVFIGDCDSGGSPAEGMPSRVLRPEKDLTDLQAAYEYAAESGFRKIFLTACTGGRQDHHIANLQLLETAAGRGVDARIIDPWNEVAFFERLDTTFSCSGFRYFSVLPADRELRGVSICGAKYPLDGVTVRRGDSLTVSNEPLDGPVTVRAEQGGAWLVLSERIS